VPRSAVNRRWWLPMLLGAATVAAHAPALADDGPGRPLDVTIEEAEGQTVVHVRDPGGDLVEPKIASSHSGFMLSFEGETVEKGHQRTNAWRLGRVQSGQYGNRAVIRLIQRKGRRGGIDEHAQVIEVDDGLDIVVLDRLTPPPALTPDAGATVTAAPTQAQPNPPAEVPSTAQTVAALQAELGPLPADPAKADAADAAPGGFDDAPPEAADPATAQVADDNVATDADAEAEPFDLSPADADDPAVAGPFAAADDADASAPPLNFAAWTLIPSILALAGLGFWMKRRKQTVTGAALEVVAKTSLGPKQQIVQVKVDGRELLLGVTEHQIGLITEVGGGASQAALGVRPAAPTPRTSAHHEFGVPAPVADREDQAASNRIEAFKARLSSALRNEVVSSDTGEASDGTQGADPRPADIGELRRLLDRRGEDPAWTREEVA